MAGTISLRQMPTGRKAIIAAIRTEGELGRRLRDLGLIPGAELEVLGRAPLQDPVALRLNGFTLSLRNNEADLISVRPL
ncbi:MAG: ferrous iron transport protein A [Desulfovibrionaceae bacterium]|nr:ferrous iron transport protein A [Desulfovibrionaceae bacterium]